MSVIKTATLTSAAIFIIASVPFIWQHNETDRSLSQLGNLQDQRRSLEILSKPHSLLGNLGRASGFQTIDNLLAASLAPLTGDELVNLLTEMAITRDPIAESSIDYRILNLSPEAYEILLNEVMDSNAPMVAIMRALELLARLAPPANHRATIERLIAEDVSSNVYSNLLFQWTLSDPAGAYEWIQNKLDADELGAKGVQELPDQILLGKLVAAMAQVDFERALDLLAHLEEGRSATLSDLSNQLIRELKVSGDETKFARFIEKLDDRERLEAIADAIHAWANEEDLNEGAAFAKRYLSDHEDQVAALLPLVTGPIAVAMPFHKRADWLMAHTALDRGTTAITQLIARSPNSTSLTNPDESLDEVVNWLGSQRAEWQDRGFQVLASKRNNIPPQKNVEFAQRIQNAELRQKALRDLAAEWLISNPHRARRLLPPDVLAEFDATPLNR